MYFAQIPRQSLSVHGLEEGYLFSLLSLFQMYIYKWWFGIAKNTDFPHRYHKSTLLIPVSDFDL